MITIPLPQRYHSLDVLRASMMGLGLVLHTAASYTFAPVTGTWPYQDKQNSIFFDLLVYWIHLFRMPLFFVIAGFFAAMMYNKQGGVSMATNRLKRVALPLIFSYLLLYPITMTGFIFTMTGGTSAAFNGAVGYLISFGFLDKPILMHFWFLYFLLIYYAAALCLLFVGKRVSTHLPVSIPSYGKLIKPNWVLLILFLVTALTLYPMTKAALDSSFSFLPAGRVLVAYGVFFGFGWLLFSRKELLGTFLNHWKRYLSAGITFSSVYLFVFMTNPFRQPILNHLLGISLAALSIWLLIFGLMGVFLRYANHPHPLGRYLSDASYWVYIFHLLPCICITGLLAPYPLPALLKFSIVFTGTLLISLFTYYLFVRSTAIGALLNGRKYPRTLPLVTPEPLRTSV